MTPRHGGELARAVAEFGHAREDWLDLSTGISPWTWPVPAVPGRVWRELPDGIGELEAAAARCYGAAPGSVVATPGSQFALGRVPGIVRRGRVALPALGYAEHEQAFVACGHRIVHYSDHAQLRQLVDAKEVDHVLVINPNNPTTEQTPAEFLLELLAVLQRRDGYLIVDEAFVDCTPQLSLASRCPERGLVVYRSIGKFYGLAGLRLGFALAPAQICGELRRQLDPWAVAHPAQWLGSLALADGDWQALQRERVSAHAAQWLEALAQVLPGLHWRSGGMFATGAADAAYCARLYRAFARRALLARRFETTAGAGLLRLGLPAEGDRERALAICAAVAGETK